MQRGVGNVNPMKMARCIQELERIYGIKHGGHGSNQYVQTLHNDNSAPTQEKLAEQMGLSISQLQRYKQLLTLIPELQELVEKDKLKPTVVKKRRTIKGKRRK
jgi:hypothetical protein